LRTRARRGKYGAIKTKVDGYVFDSKAEAWRYGELKLLLKAGKILGLLVHPAYLLQEAFKRDGETIRRITYEADFAYMEDLSTPDKFHVIHVAEDVKGVETEVFKIKRKLFLFKYPHIELRLTGVNK